MTVTYQRVAITKKTAQELADRITRHLAGQRLSCSDRREPIPGERHLQFAVAPWNRAGLALVIQVSGMTELRLPADGSVEIEFYSDKIVLHLPPDRLIRI